MYNFPIYLILTFEMCNTFKYDTQHPVNNSLNFISTDIVYPLTGPPGRRNGKRPRNPVIPVGDARRIGYRGMGGGGRGANAIALSQSGPPALMLTERNAALRLSRTSSGTAAGRSARGGNVYIVELCKMKRGCKFYKGEILIFSVVFFIVE